MPPTIPTILVINESTVLSDSQIVAIVPSLQTQVTRDFYPVWGINANLVFHDKSQPLPVGAWWLTVLDDSDQADALGYHDLTNDGLPIGKVFAASDLKAGTSWTVTASHELLEMLADPDIDLTVFLQDGNTTGQMYAYEVSDACEGDNFGYEIDGVLVSDFVFPAWFESFHKPNSVQFDFQKEITEPFGLLAGGYIGIFDVTAGSGWQQKQAQAEEPNSFARGKVGSRRERRSLLRNRWIRSHPFPKIRKNAEVFARRIGKMTYAAMGKAS